MHRDSFAFFNQLSKGPFSFQPIIHFRWLDSFGLYSLYDVDTLIWRARKMVMDWKWFSDYIQCLVNGIKTKYYQNNSTSTSRWGEDLRMVKLKQWHVKRKKKFKHLCKSKQSNDLPWIYFRRFHLMASFV